jgi:hypothetical protein
MGLIIRSKIIMRAENFWEYFKNEIRFDLALFFKEFPKIAAFQDVFH